MVARLHDELFAPAALNPAIQDGVVDAERFDELFPVGLSPMLG